MHTDNPAGRLLNILQEGQKKGKHLSCRQVWQEILNLEEDNLPLLMSRLGKVMQLPQQIISQIQTHFPNQTNSHRHWSSKVNTAFGSQQLNGQWKDFMVHIDSQTMDLLSMSVDFLDMKEQTTILSKEQLSNMHQEVSNLITETIEADIEEGFKRYVLKYLRKILVAIEEYQISGVSPILESIEVTFGHAFIDENYRENMKSTDVGKKTLQVLSALASIVTVVTGLPQIQETFQFLISSSE